MEFPPPYLYPGLADMRLPGGMGIIPVPRSEWGAKPPKAPAATLEIPAMNMVIEWADVPACTTPKKCVSTVKNIQKLHFDAGESDIKYNFVVGGDGRAYEGRGWRQQCPPFPASATDGLQEFHQKTMYVGVIEQKDKLPTKTLIDAVTMLISQGVVSMYLDKDVKVHALKNGHIIPFSKRRI